jgi:hypothetical protein
MSLTKSPSKFLKFTNKSLKPVTFPEDAHFIDCPHCDNGWVEKEGNSWTKTLYEDPRMVYVYGHLNKHSSVCEHCSGVGQILICPHCHSEYQSGQGAEVCACKVWQVAA